MQKVERALGWQICAMGFAQCRFVVGLGTQDLEENSGSTERHQCIM